MRTPLRAVAAAGLFLAGTLTTVVGATPAHADTQICDQFGTTTIGGRYVVMNNRWGSSNPQCINVTSTGFQITQSGANKATNGAPAAYPAVYLGCHYTNCSPGSNLPMQLSQIGSATSNISYTYVSNATFDAAYDIWLDPTAKRDGVNQTEIMIWFNHVGPVQPVGSQVGTTTLGGRSWAVWTGNNGQNNVVSYVAPSAIPSWNFSVLDFINDVKSRGFATSAWFLTSIQAGFEPWIGGTGLAITAFSATVGGGTSQGGDTQAPSTPGQPTASNITSSGVSLNWAASTDNTGVTGYDVLRATGGGAATVVGTATGTSFTDSGLAASTTYTYSVRARDAAGNTSGTSAGRSVTTASGGGTGNGGCTATYRTTGSWQGGFQAEVTVTAGTAAINGWTVKWTFADGSTINNLWNAQWTPSGTAVTARSIAGQNAALAANASTAFGFVGNGAGAVPTPTCTSP
jgi:hypothetical protein